MFLSWLHSTLWVKKHPAEFPVGIIPGITEIDFHIVLLPPLNFFFCRITGVMLYTSLKNSVFVWKNPLSSVISSWVSIFRDQFVILQCGLSHPSYFLFVAAVQAVIPSQNGCQFNR